MQRKCQVLVLPCKEGNHHHGEKKEIVIKCELGVKLIDLAKEFGLAVSTIGTILKEESVQGIIKPIHFRYTISEHRHIKI